MHSPSFIKLQNLRRVAQFAEQVGQPILLSRHDREIFPPINPPLPTLNRVPEGWACVDVVTNPDWESLLGQFEAYQEHGFAILGNQFNNEPGLHVGRFVRQV